MTPNALAIDQACLDDQALVAWAQDGHRAFRHIMQRCNQRLTGSHAACSMTAPRLRT